MQTKCFLFEIGTEEMPSAPLINAARQLESMAAKGLDDAGISSPRRLAVQVEDVAEATEEIHDVKRGPAANIAFDAEGNPTKAACGFARKCGVDSSELIRREDTDGREYVFAEKNIASAPALPLLTELCSSLISDLDWPNYRSQRWGSTHETFVRPVRWLCAMFDDEVIPVTFAGVQSGNTTRGHRVMAPGEHVVTEALAYENVLKDAFVNGPMSWWAVSTRSSSPSRMRSSASPCFPTSVISPSMMPLEI